ncbi:MAG: NAD(P)-dependent alcohol dehydrogenase [Solirubrobacteraceae bacterium]
MRSTTAYATSGPSAPFEKTTIQRRDLGPKDVLVKIHYAGICHSDIHTARNEWGEAIFPLVPGHEIAGTVEAIGSDVRSYGEGDRVGVGCMVDSCRECEACQAGEEQYCLKGMIGTYNAIGKDGRPTEGGYSTHIVVDEDFVVNIPDGIGLDVAAPLLCAGITLYSPLNHWNAGPGRRVAIVGMGGLGHMGVKIAHALGAEVTVLSQTLSKQEDGLRLGADHFYATSDETTFEQLKGHFDLIINTVSAVLPIDSYLAMLRRDGTMVNVGAPPQPLPVQVFSLIGNRRSFAGSAIGGIRETQEMLDFCAEHGLGAEIETISGDRIDEAWERVLASDVRYRFVIDIATFES